jgi:hypothetical protein
MAGTLEQGLFCAVTLCHLSLSFLFLTDKIAVESCVFYSTTVTRGELKQPAGLNML